MGSLCDVNVLVAIVHDAHEHCPVANDWLSTVTRPRQVRVCRVSQLGFLRLITSPRILGGDALPAMGAWQASDALMGDDRFSYMEEPPGTGPAFRELSGALHPGAVCGTDVYLAALARADGLEVVTFDRGFRRFPDLQTRVLSAP